MTTAYSDTQILDHFTDGLKKAADAAERLAKLPLLTGVAGALDFMDGLKASAGAAHQMAHARQNPHFFNIRDQLERMRTLVGRSMPSRHTWLAIGKMLEVFRESSSVLANAKPLPRSDVLKMLDRGEKNIAARVEQELARGHAAH